ncbi:MAG: PDZ domain-containing protein, partial [Saprospiraceae bacterium]
PVWEEAFAKMDVHGIQVKTSKSGIGPSDHTSFYLKDIPAIHFFSGQHSDYHKPEDDSELVNFEGMYEIADFIITLIDDLNSDGKIAFTKTKDENQGRKAAAFKVTLGVMPDYVHDGTGMRIDAVLSGRAAEKGGIENGDIIVKMGDREVKDIYDYMEGLASFKSGDKTIIVVERKGERLEKVVKF